MRFDFEWYGAGAAIAWAVPAIKPLYPACPEKHTAGYICHRAKGHRGRHLSSGTVYVLAVWLPSGKFDAGVMFTDEEKRALDIDAGRAFF